MRADATGGSRAAAIGALVIGIAAFVLALIAAIQEFPQGLIVLGLVCLSGIVAWYGVLRRGLVRAAGLTMAVILLAVAVLLLIGDRALEVALIVGGLVVALACARAAMGGRADLPSAPAPEHPILVLNPRSGGGKAEQFSLEAEARARGIEPIELGPGQDLETIVRDAVARGA